MKQALDDNFFLKPYKQTHGVVRLLGMMMIWFSLFDTAGADQRIEKDLDRNGQMDQVLIYNDAGTILRVETDANEDGFIEKTQIYTEGTLVRIERDIDDDQKIDCLDLIENEKRVRQEIMDPSGNLIQVSLFDDKEQIQEMKKDTTRNRRFDTHYYFNKGVLAASTRDTDDNGNINIWTTFENQVPVEQKQDENEDGIMDRVLMFNSTGRLKKLFKDPHGKEKFKTLIFYEAGEMKLQHQDENKDGKPDIITRFEKGLPVEQKKDLNFDGRMDVTTQLSNSLPTRQEKDADFDGKTDYFAVFDDRGQLAQTREDTKGFGKIDRVRLYKAGVLYRVELDGDGNGFFESVSLMENNQVDKTLVDTNQDGAVDQEVFFDEHQTRIRAIYDSNFDGKQDIWEFYADNILSRREQDENFDEILDCVAHYSKTGTLEKFEEWDQGSPRVTWYYDSKGIPVRGEEDKNRDGKVEVWYAYEKGILKRVEEDTNGDGRPDLWEEYDETQTIVKREKDLDFDGRPDFTDVKETAETGS